MRINDRGETLISVVIAFIIFSGVFTSSMAFLQSVISKTAELPARNDAIVAADHHTVPMSTVDCFSSRAQNNQQLIDYCNIPVPSTEWSTIVVDETPADGSDVSFVETTQNAILGVRWVDYLSASPPDITGSCESPLQPLPTREVTVRWRPGSEADFSSDSVAEGDKQFTRIVRGAASYENTDAVTWVTWTDDPTADYLGHEIAHGDSSRTILQKSTHSGCSVIVLEFPGRIREICSSLESSAWQQLSVGANTLNKSTSCS